MISIGQVCSQASESLASHIASLELQDYSGFTASVAAGHSLILIGEGNNLGLASAELGEKSLLEIDFVGGSLGHRRQFGGGRNQDICRAVGLNRNPDISVGDATAGLGRDAFVMALQGAHVSAHEKNPILISMLTWSLMRAIEVADQDKDQLVLRGALNRLRFLEADSSSELLKQSFDVVYLDPMFPDRDKSAKVKKEMQILHQLLSEDASSDQELFESCWSAANARLVVKRPAKAPMFAQREPHHQIMGKAIRYDVYVKRALI